MRRSGADAAARRTVRCKETRALFAGVYGSGVVAILVMTACGSPAPRACSTAAAAPIISVARRMIWSGSTGSTAANAHPVARPGDSLSVVAAPLRRAAARPSCSRTATAASPSRASASRRGSPVCRATSRPRWWCARASAISPRRSATKPRMPWQCAAVSWFSAGRAASRASAARRAASLGLLARHSTQASAVKDSAMPAGDR